MFLAYIDPGLGALLWQATVAGVVGFLFYLRKTRRWIVDVCLKMSGRRQSAPPLSPGIPTRKNLAAKVESEVEVR